MASHELFEVYFRQKVKVVEANPYEELLQLLTSAAGVVSNKATFARVVSVDKKGLRPSFGQET